MCLVLTEITRFGENRSNPKLSNIEFGRWVLKKSTDFKSYFFFCLNDCFIFLLFLQDNRRLQTTSARTRLGAPPDAVVRLAVVVVRVTVLGVRRVPAAVPPELRRGPISPPPAATAAAWRHRGTATDPGHADGGAADAIAKVRGRCGGRRRMLVATAQRRPGRVRAPTAATAAAPTPTPSPSADGRIPVAPPAAATAARHGRRTAVATGCQNDAATTAEGGQGAADPQTDECVHGVGQGGAQKVGRREPRLAQRRSQQDAR